MADLNKLSFISSENYMKRSEFCGSATLTLPSYGNTVSQTITHNLGFIPFYTVCAQIDTTDAIWTDGKVSALTDQAYLSGLGADPTYPQLDSWITTTQLVIQFTNLTDPVATGDRTVYWLIYKDYGQYA